MGKLSGPECFEMLRDGFFVGRYRASRFGSQQTDRDPRDAWQVSGQVTTADVNDVSSVCLAAANSVRED